MLNLESITPNLALTGLDPTGIGTVVAVVPIADGAVQVIYRTSDGGVKERLLNRADEATLSIATIERPWSFDGDGEAFKLTVEAKRIDLAFLFDPMMAVHTSNVEPLPHQITAVYESMLPRQPLRFVLADDPGAGKTIMAGLYIRELIMRADARRIVIVAPGSLVDQWREEMFEKFGLEFRVFTKDLEAATPSGNPFEDIDHLIVRLDQMARNEELQEKLCAAGWDLVVFDEAHKLAAHFFGNKLEKTGRFKLAEKLGVSRGPIREAFRMLEEAGLLRNEKNRGVFVRDIPIDEAIEIFDLRAVMDELVGRQLASRITPAQLDEVHALVDAMEQAVKDDDAYNYHVLNLRFHDRLVEMAGNRKLTAIYRKLIKELSLFRRLNLADGWLMPVSAGEHRQIVEAIASGNADIAGRAMFAHAMESKERTIENDLHRQARTPAKAAGNPTNPPPHTP